MSVNSKMVAAGLEVFEEYLAWEGYPYTNEQLVGAILRAAMSSYEHPVKTSVRPHYSSGFVYFVKCGDLIKIGKAADIQKRVASIQTSAPDRLELLGHLDGGYRKEREMHRMFASHRTTGEWFNDCREIRDYIKANCIKVNENKDQKNNTYKLCTPI